VSYLAIWLGRRRHNDRRRQTRLPAPAGAIAALLGVVGALSVAGGATTVIVAGAAAAAPIAHCSAHAGVLIVVDFSHFGGRLVRGCSSSTAAGLEGMHEAGFVTVGDQSDGSAFVCRIGLAGSGAPSERPTPSEDACILTPPADAYWSFWYADGGGDRWSYSAEGVDSFRPAVGSVEAWEFGSGTPPAANPSQVRVASPASAAAKTGAPGADGARSARSVASVGPGGGTPTTFLAATLAVVALCALAATVARRRRRVGRQ
jgi:hypothetical protein